MDQEGPQFPFSLRRQVRVLCWDAESSPDRAAQRPDAGTDPPRMPVEES
jgi:hypothetical protein